ncbi:hypothetical protein MKW92_038454 [Papaver armeniacum]|nr:hypothetical protein MKW92_038454 [Papaver armeniacum]
MDKYDTIAEMKRNMPERLIAKREDWESFVDFCNTDEDKKRLAAGKKAREAVELLQSCSRKGISRAIYELEKESPTDEINRCVVFATTHVTKTVNDPASTSASDVKIRKIKELVDANPEGFNDIDNDAISKALLSPNCLLQRIASSKTSEGEPLLWELTIMFFAPMEHAYSVCVEEIFDRGAELFDEDGTLGDIMLWQVINWPKGSVRLLSVINHITTGFRLAL